LGIRFWTLIVATLLAFLGIGTVLPGMALHIRHDLGGTDQTVGFVIGTFSVLALGSRFISGPLTDHKGRKVAFLTGLVVCAIAGVTYLLPIGIASAYLGRGLQGFAEACLYTGAAAWAVETAGIHRSSRALGYVSSGIWGGISAGPVVGQWLGSFQHAAMMQTIAAIAAFALLWRVPEDYNPHVRERQSAWSRLKESFGAGLAIGTVNMQYPVITGFLILYMAQTGGSGPTAFSAWAMMVLFARFFFGGLPDRIPPGYTFYGGLTSMAIGLSLLAFLPGPIMSMTGAILLGLGFAFPWSSIAAVVLKRTPSHSRGSAVGVLSAFVDVFVGTSSFAAGTLAEHYGYSAAFQMALAGVALAAIAGIRVFRKSS
jgi:MFS family permease